MKPQINFSWMGLLTLLSVSSFASTKPSVQVILPKPLNFTFSVLQKKTDCSRLDQLIQKYLGDDCMTNPVSITRCTMDLKKIVSEAQSDVSRESLDFVSQYQIDGVSRVQNAPVSPSHRFDVSYLYSATMLNVSQVKFEVNPVASSTYVSMSEKLDLEPGIQIINRNGSSLVETNNRLYACAIETGDVALTAKIDLDITAYHPLDRERHEVLAEIYKRAQALVDSEQPTGVKQFLLGVAVADLFRQKNYSPAKDETLEAVAMSAYRLVMKDQNQNFILSSDLRDPNQAVDELLETLASVSGVAVKLGIKR